MFVCTKQDRGQKVLEGGEPRYLAPGRPEFLLRDGKIEAGKSEPNSSKVSVRNKGGTEEGKHRWSCPF